MLLCIAASCLQVIDIYFPKILAGIYPVAQLQEPYTSVGYLCERTPYLSVLKLKHPSLQEKGSQQERHGTTEPSWTAWEVCEGKELNPAASV